jgi:UDP-GlcNAc:undecaprenyl-phosphate GlcNAc-1-phosphate transferase
VAVAIPLMAFGLPIVDTGFTIVRRFLSRKPLFTGDREHVHHMLLARGWSQKRAALVLYAVCAGFGLFTLLFVESSEHTTGVVLFVLGICIMLAVSQLRYHEFEEIKASVKRNVGDRRVRGANNITVRRASRNLANAATLGELYGAVVEVLTVGEFNRAVMIIGESHNRESNEALLRREPALAQDQQAHVRDGMIWWTWQAGPENLDRSDSVWSLRLPLVTVNGALGHLNLYRAIGPEDLLLDINYLCTLFQEELAKATERLLAQTEGQARSMAVGA